MTVQAPSPAPATAAASGPSNADAPEISRSRGEVGGVVVLWPRIVMPRGVEPDAATSSLAKSVQDHFAELARATAAHRPVDVRPAPERVCPREGCQATTVGLLLARAGDGCAVVATVSKPGPSAATLVVASPGHVELAAPSVAFREPPERVVRVKDYAACSTLVADLAAKDADVRAALQSAL